MLGDSNIGESNIDDSNIDDSNIDERAVRCSSSVTMTRFELGE